MCAETQWVANINEQIQKDYKIITVASTFYIKFISKPEANLCINQTVCHICRLPLMYHMQTFPAIIWGKVKVGAFVANINMGLTTKWKHMKVKVLVKKKYNQVV